MGVVGFGFIKHHISCLPPGPWEKLARLWFLQIIFIIQAETKNIYGFIVRVKKKTDPIKKSDHIFQHGVSDNSSERESL